MRNGVLLFLSAVVATQLFAKEPIDYVNPLIGTASRRADTGNSAGMMPYVCPPFAAVEWVPMTRLSEVGILSFGSPDKKFLGFIGSRQPAIWMGEWGQLSVAPQATREPACDYRKRGLELDKDKCVYTPYYAKVVTKEGIIAELAGASHAAIMRFTYPPGAPKRLVVDASRVFLGHISCTNAFPGAIEFAGNGTLRTWNDDFVDQNNSDPKSAPHVKYVLECSEPYATTGVYVGGARTGFRQKSPGSPIPEDAYPPIVQRPGESAAEGDCVGGWADFPGAGRTLLVKIGSSTIDEATARENLQREIGEGFDFDHVVAETKAAWVRQLAPISIEAPENVKTIFYTAMYHAALYPRDISEGGRYLSPYDGKVHAGDMYTNYSMWDTYRAEHALLTLVAPHRVDGMMNALLNAYREGGWLPKWPNPGYSGQMVGGCAEMLLAEAYSKGFRGFDVNVAYEAVKKNATVPQVNDDEVRWADRQFWTGYNETRGGLSNYMRLGYVAADVTAESVSRTQDFGLNDTAAAILADATGHSDDARMFRSRMKNYTNLWDVAHQRFWPKNKDGRWAEKLHRGWNMTIGHDFTEQSPETAIWGIPYDLPGLIGLCGGRSSFEKKLDRYFDKIFWTGRTDGLSCHENETTHHISYLYAAAGIPEKTAKNVRRILTETYSDQEWGMEGNEDCGQMSAWYILSSLGFYPLNPATDEYVIGSPLVEQAVIAIGSPYKPTTFTIVAKNQAGPNYVVKSVKLNGVELKDRRIRQADIVKGGVLEFEMTDASLFRPGDRVAWIGDSITSGGHRTPTGYITTLERAAHETQTPGFDDIIGLGFSGWHVYAWQGYERKSVAHPELPSRFARVPTMGDVLTNRLDVIVIALGINDHGLPTFPDDDIAQWEAEYDKMITNLKERSHPRKFVLCSMTAYTCDPTAAGNRRLVRMNRRIEALAAKHGALFVDFWTPAWRTIERVRQMQTGLRDLQDLLHPGVVGNVEMALAFAQAANAPEPMLRWLAQERERRYAALEAKLGPTPRLVCQLWPDKEKDRPGAASFAYVIPWNLVGAKQGQVRLELPSGWTGSVTQMTPTNGVARVRGETLLLENKVVLVGDLPERTLSEKVSIPAPWFVSPDFTFPAAWKKQVWHSEAVPPVKLTDVKDWRSYTSTWNFAGDVDPGAIDLRATNVGLQKGAAYVRRLLRVPCAKRLVLKVGTTFWSARNGLRIWCDGQLVGETVLESGWKDGKSYSCQDRSFVLDLGQGLHDLAVLTANFQFDHYFHVRVLDEKTGAVPDDVQVVIPLTSSIASSSRCSARERDGSDVRCW